MLSAFPAPAIPDVPSDPMVCPNGHGDWHLSPAGIATCLTCTAQWRMVAR